MQALIEEADYVVCLAVETTGVAKGNGTRRLFEDDALQRLTLGALQEYGSAPRVDQVDSVEGIGGRLVSMDWCTYSLRDNKVVSDHSCIINPNCVLDKQDYLATGLNN